ncbi:lipopolysaccharide biosynthesis protein [Vibrio methylphosphonaticus]|uniref:lipopolysaccharide biosynthesis protein n=1 Tax=Vibrio methylphosphonaticus TaxID=2946866 RepID=UPI00202A32AB|nr:oligosaccharide flippase family protein [Vibrio methylphosphonaticus]MCL9774406.1 oligosaccharide flippase family protein [Vibrio methylphosphonaticus]
MNKSWQHFITYGFSIVLTRGLSLIMLPFITRYLAPEQIGKLELLATISVFIGLFITFCLHEALYRYAGHFTCVKKQYVIANRLFTLSCLVAAIIGLPFCLIAITVDHELLSPISHKELLLVLVSVLFIGPLSVSTAWLRMQDKARSFFVISAIASLIQVIWIVVALNLHATVAAVLWAGLVATLFQMVALQVANQFRLRKVPKSQVKQYLIYSLPIVGSGVVAFGLSGAERWILAANTSLLELGLYAIAAKFALAMCLLVQPFGMWWMPKRFQMIKEQGRTAVIKVSQAGLIYIFMLVAAMSYAAPLFISIALPTDYEPAITFIVPALMIAMFKEMGEITNIGILYRKQTQHLFSINLISAIVGVTCAFWAGKWGIIPILAVLSLVGIGRFFAISLISHRLYNLNYDCGSLVALATLSIGFCFMSLYVEDNVSRLIMCALSPIFILLTALILQRFAQTQLPTLQQQSET